MPVAIEAGPVRVELAGELETGMAVTDLALFVNQVATGDGGRGYEIQAEYDTGLYRRQEVETLLDLWLRLLRGVAADPDRPVSEVELLSQDQRRTLLDQGRGPALPADRPATVVEAITSRAAETPGSVAVVGRDGALTYAQLSATSGRLAAALAAGDASRGDPVGVCVPRDRMLPAALLGVMRSGAAYVPLDPEHPADRLAFIAADCGVGLVVSRGDALPAASAIPGVSVVDVDRLPGGGEPPAPPGPDDPAYVLYTSGSTGRPKGVEVCHASLADHTAAMRSVPGIDAGDAMLALAPLTFDVAGTEIWSPLSVGGRCLIVERDRVLDAHALATRMSELRATVAFLPPTVLRMLLSAGWSGDCRLRVWCGGEAVDPALAREALPLVGELWNAYGPTETTILSAVYHVREAGEAVPIGRPLPGERGYVVDAYGRLLPPGMVGELWIGGSGVARGYRRRPELTEAAFVPDPYVSGGRCYRTGDLARWTRDGLLEFVGRVDHQVKVRGQRIELGEIEAVLHEYPDVSQAVVTVHGEGGDASLTGYLAPQTVEVAGVERFCRGRLPDYMVPGRWMLLAAMPTTASGKADRRALPEPAALSPQDSPPQTDMEKFIAEVWSDVLGVAEVGRHSDFLALGGNSFAATRVVARVRSVLGCELPVGPLFERPVLADLAAEVERLALDHLAGTEAST
jgi:amino acid adenylation domain-containing protein